ncbi:MAG: pantoate--beta-alanine ligase [Gammaproteobacteria bacterium]|nr:pantoate--beta-alanine ligase [Gammaproteobacteria bacterium]
MQTFKAVSELRAQVSVWKREGLTVGLVPTMGNLHAGHLSLVSLAKTKCDRVVVSIFVNPMQFGPNEDYEQYPRTLASDCSQLEAASADGVFLPAVSEMYPHGLNQTVVSVPVSITGMLEGAKRPGHFDGVSTVVCKLFNMVQPDLTVFGQKDFQQLAVIQKMVRDLALPTGIIAAPIARDVDGLALSSRNQYLSASERLIAPKLQATLLDIKVAIQSGNRQFSSLCTVAKNTLLAVGFSQVDYIEVCDADSLLPANKQTDSLVILAVARLGKTRLLDNILL